ncbi:hypothetical protein KXD40_000488 [Peronospora effusa]|nr:hypothetical protein KXD40_000488 [Peronospora effusa]
MLCVLHSLSSDLESRLLPDWVLEMKCSVLTSDANLCPKMLMLFLDHNWGGFTESPRWPKDKSVYMIPTIVKRRLHQCICYE